MNVIDFGNLTLIQGAPGVADNVGSTTGWQDINPFNVSIRDGNLFYHSVVEQHYYALTYDVDEIIATDGIYINLNTQSSAQWYRDLTVDQDVFVIASTEWITGLLTGSTSSTVVDIGNDGVMDTRLENSVGGFVDLRGFDIANDGIEIIGTYDGGVLVNLLVG